MTKKTRFLTLVCALAGCFAIYGCSNDKKDNGNQDQTEAECQIDADCASNAEGKTECDTDNKVCVKPVVAETCGNGALDDGEQCDGTQIASDLSLDCGTNKRLLENLTCDTKTCKIDLTSSCELDPDTAECTSDEACADNAEGKTKCDLDKGVCVESSIVTPPGPTEYPECEYPDEDGDGISDMLEGKEDNRDSDSDTIPDYQDLDSDDDTIPDSIEGGTNGCSGNDPAYNGNGEADYINDDVDGNKIPDGVECCGAYKEGGTCLPGFEADADGFYQSCVDTDVDGEFDYIDEDNDQDGLIDTIEIVGAVNSKANLGEGQFAGDCDGDGNPDSVGDEKSPLDCDGDEVPDYMDFDSDGDGILDSIELEGINEASGLMARYLKDTDGDSILDGDEVSKDGNGNKYICDAKGVRKTEDGHDLVENSEGVVGYYDGDEFKSVDLVDDPNHYYEPLSTCTDQDCKFRTNCYLTVDCDRDGLNDDKEVWCDGGKWSGLQGDTDEDSYMDASEYAVYEYAKNNGITTVKVNGNDYAINSAADLICISDVGVTNVIDFYFELPFVSDDYIAETIENSKKEAEAHPDEQIDVIENEEEFWEKNPDRLPKNESLIFDPAVSKLDLVINVDTTSSMTEAIKSVKTNVTSLVEKIQGVKNAEGVFENAMVSDAGFALTTFDDFPISNYGSGGDLPFRLLGAVTTDKDKVISYTQKSDFKVRNGGDLPEAGAESLYQIATGEGVSWGTGKVDPRVNAVKGTWGGVGFREGSLPVVVHVTDAPSHDISTSYNSFSEDIAYTPADVPAPHYSDVLIPKLKDLGIRVITLYVGHQDANKYNQMYTWAKESDAVVPVCAFSTETEAATQCKLGKESAPESLNGKDNQCVLFYQGEQGETANFVSQGVDAIVKYGTYDVSTVVRGEPISGIVDENGNEVAVDTSCFIKQVNAVQYIAPPNEPEHSCNPVAIKNKIGDSEFDNGFTNFAPGTSNVYDPNKPEGPGNKRGAQLEFQVVAQNFDCVPETEEVQVFKAYIDVIDPTTGLVFGTREVSIIVPAKPIVINDPTN